MYSPLVYSKISYGMIKVVDLSCIFSMILRVKNKKCLLFTTKSISERIYCDVRGKISNLLNRFLHETLLLQPIMILIILFCILNIIVLWGEFPQKGRP